MQTLSRQIAKDIVTSLGDLELLIEDLLESIFPKAASPIHRCPVNLTGGDCSSAWGGVQRSALSIVMHLNDDHRWTREDIASWLDEIGV